MLDQDIAPEKPLSPRAIIAGVAAYRNLPLNVVIGPRLNQAATRVRFEAYYMLRELTNLSLPDIGRKFGSRDHTTIMHGLNRISQMIRNDEDYAGEIEALRLFLVDAHHATAEPETILDRARRIIAQPSSARAGDATPLAVGILTVMALLNKEGMTEREARLAALSALREMKGVANA